MAISKRLKRSNAKDGRGYNKWGTIKWRWTEKSTADCATIQGTQRWRRLRWVLKLKVQKVSDTTSVKVIYTPAPSSVWDIKDRTPLQHQHNLVYSVIYPNDACNVPYIGETCRRFKTSADKHRKERGKSNMVVHHFYPETSCLNKYF